MNSATVASAYKVLYHREKVDAFCRGEVIFPVTLELDLTSQCTRICPDCPSSRSRFHAHLEARFVDRLLGSLSGRTRGLLLTGGEPTMSPLFPWALRSARERGFEEIAVVTNGSLLHREPIVAALLSRASTIRLSLYDWEDSGCFGALSILRKIELLRKRIESLGSELKIGVSLLTSSERAERLVQMAEAVRDAGAHWVYFHPVCLGWDRGAPVQVDQGHVMAVIDRWRRSLDKGFGAHLSPERYSHSPLHFDGYHGAHFLMIVGADGINYLGAEVKYQPDFALGDAAADWSETFLGDPRRLARIAAIQSKTYSAIGSRHRGALYSHVLQEMKRNGNAGSSEMTGKEFSFAHIL